MLIGVDVGGTKMLGLAASVASVAASADGTDIGVLGECRVPTPTAGDALVESLVALVRTLEHDCKQRVTALAVGIAGLIDRRGVVQYSPHLADVVQLPLAERLSDALRCPVVVENDLTTATLAEARLGAGRGSRDLVMVGLGTGIGTKFMIDGALVRGANGFAGEAGHMTVDRGGARHVTGLAGAWEMYGSGTGLGVLARQAALDGTAPSLVALAGSAEAVTGETVSTAIGTGDVAALKVLDAYAEQVAIGVANLIMVLDPQRVILGGGVSELGEPLRSRVEAAAQRRVVGAAYRPAVPVVLAELGERAGALGAVLAAQGAAGRVENPTI
ncbi:MAG: ROK family protein [Acidimicrobiales bacterium]